MAKAKNIEYVCQNCGAMSPKWSGKCVSCNSWNTIEEQTPTPSQSNLAKLHPLQIFDLNTDAPTHGVIDSKIAEFNRVIGGGIVQGSVMLISGEPGIGKSTLLLQIGANYPQNCFYISGEEGVNQIQMRAQRLGLQNKNLNLVNSNNLEQILSIIEDKKLKASLVIIDSIQTLYSSNVGASMGSVGQIRFCTHEIVERAKASNVTVIIVGHITKDGNIAGPKLLEHMVDSVLHFEGDNNYHLRILRCLKNRFGPVDEIGVFEMSAKGLQEVGNPSLMFLDAAHTQKPGAVIFAASEGSRPILLEIQALVARSYLNMPRRDVIGWDHNRLAMILAVLDSRAKLHGKTPLLGNDIYLNITGGVRIKETAADLAAAAALISSYLGKSIEGVFIGEIGLSGEIRAVPKLDLRLREAIKLGFTKAFIPPMKKELDLPGITVTELKSIRDLVELF